MAEPLSEQALVKLVQILSGMTGTRFWGGKYPNDPQVLRELRFPEQVTQCPTICVKESSGSQCDAATPLEAAGAQMVLTDRFVVALWGHVANDGLTLASTWLMRLRYDMRQTIVANISLGGLARSIAFGLESTDEGLNWPRAFVRIPITIVLDQVFSVDA